MSDKPAFDITTFGPVSGPVVTQADHIRICREEISKAIADRDREWVGACSRKTQYPASSLSSTCKSPYEFFDHAYETGRSTVQFKDCGSARAEERGWCEREVTRSKRAMAAQNEWGHGYRAACDSIVDAIRKRATT